MPKLKMQLNLRFSIASRAPIFIFWEKIFFPTFEIGVDEFCAAATEFALPDAG
jgi:hypothetical protein